MILQQPYLNHKCIPEMYPQKSTLEVVYLVTALKMRSKFFQISVTNSNKELYIR